MNEDGISYLDIGDAFLRADWENAINPVWSPIYSLLLGIINFLIKPPIEWEFPTVHILNFFIFLSALIGFEFMWKKIQSARSIERHDGYIALPNWAWWSIGYSLFIWISLSLIQIWAVTPDMLMATFVLLAGGIIAQIRTGNPQNWWTYLSLGLVLGLGYLTKTFMFAIALVFLGIGLIVVQRRWRSIAKPLFSAGIFLLISLPFIFLISENKGKSTIGEAGTITYMRHVNGVPYPHWQGDAFNDLIHPSRIIYPSPRIYEFGEPIGGTYPISTDPSYWYDGIEIRFNLRNQLARLFASSLFYLELFFLKQGFLVASVIVLYVMGQRQRLTFLEVIKRWALVIPALIAFGLYGLVLVFGRYIGVFVLLFWADILANIRLPDNAIYRSWLNILSAVAILGLLATIFVFNLGGFARLYPSIQSNGDEQATAQPIWPGQVAQRLHQLGVERGDRVAIIGHAFDSFWARLARVRIVAEMPASQADDYWLGNATLQRDVLRAFVSAGADAVVAEDVPEYATLTYWHRVGDSNHYIYILTK
jgi:hypothetical protein